MKKMTPNSDPEITMQADVDEIFAEKAEDEAAHLKSTARLRLLWDRRRFLLSVVVYGFLASLLLALLIPKRYESTARLMPPDSQSSSNLALAAMLAGRTGGLGTMAGELLGLRTTSALFVGILRSRTVEDRLVEEFNLRRAYRIIPIGSRRIEDVRAELEDHTQISEDRKNGIITITVIDSDPQQAAAIAKAYVRELDQLVAEVSTSAARRERIFLEERLKAVKADLDSASKEFSQFASKNTAIDIQQQGKAMVEAAGTLQGQLIAAQTELEGLKQIYTENNVRIRAAGARVAELQKNLEKLRGKDTTTNGISGVESNSLYPSIRELPLLGVAYSNLYRRTKIAEVVYELLTQQYELAKVQEAKEIPTVKVVDEPVVPEKKSFPPRLLIMFLGTTVSLAFAACWVIASARWEETDSQDPRRVLAQEVFATVKSQLSLASQNGSGVRAMTLGVWRRLRRRDKQPEQTK